VPFDLADAVLEEAGGRERRLRLLPSRAGVYFVLAICLFPQAGYLGVWGKLMAALDGLGLAVPSAKALRDPRRRIGIAPLRLLFEMLAGPLGPAADAGDHVRGIPDRGLRRLPDHQGPRPQAARSEIPEKIRPGQLGKANLSYTGRHRWTRVALPVCRLARSTER
jgi:hypothetical protein